MVMFLHQMHYFTYVYGVLAYVMGKKDIEKAVLYFVCTWVTYTMVSPLLQKTKKNEFKKWFFVGHTMLSVILISMSFLANNIEFYIVLWILAGFGGGTVFCITKLWKQIENNNFEIMIVAENLGHWCGSVLGVIVMTISQNISVITSISACFAILAMLVMWKGVQIQNGYK